MNRVEQRTSPDHPMVVESTDQALMERIREGDREAYRTLLHRYWRSLVGYAAGFSGSRDGAEDIVQDAFIRVWQRRSAWTPGGTVSAYLYRITRNLALNAERDHRAELDRRQRFSTGFFGPGQERDPERDFAERRARQAIDAAVAALPGRRQEVFVLSRYHGLSHREIAEAMGIAPQTVANQMRMALAELREALSHLLDVD